MEREQVLAWKAEEVTTNDVNLITLVLGVWSPIAQVVVNVEDLIDHPSFSSLQSPSVVE